MSSHGHSHSHNGTPCQHDHGHHSRDPEPPAAPAAAVLTEQAADSAFSAPTPADLLIMAVRSGSREMCEEVVAKHPDSLQGTDSDDGATAVHWASLMGNVDLTGWLAEQGAHITAAVASSGMQPIHWAATRGHTDVVKLLLKLGADIDAKDVKVYIIYM